MSFLSLVAVGDLRLISSARNRQRLLKEPSKRDTRFLFEYLASHAVPPFASRSSSEKSCLFDDGDGTRSIMRRTKVVRATSSSALETSSVHGGAVGRVA
jgi:hypothetical protein